MLISTFYNLLITNLLSPMMPEKLCAEIDFDPNDDDPDFDLIKIISI